MDTSAWNGNPPVVNLFPNGRWRALALNRLSIYLSLRQFFPLIILIHLGLYVITSLWRLLRAAYRLLTASRPNSNNVQQPQPRTLDYIMYWGYKAVKWWPNNITIYAWWYVYACLQDEQKFRTHYMNAWDEKLGNRCSLVHIFVDGSHFHALIPGNTENVDDADDAQTLEFLRMWYCEYRLRRGLGEILLAQKLTRVDKIQTVFAKGAWYSSTRVDTLDLGRTRESNISFFEDPWRVKGQVEITRQLLDMKEQQHGLEFIRTWNITAISAVVLLPFGLSIAFAATWIAVYVAKGTDVQVAVQTAFTVSSYIVTAGALFIALIAFFDAQSPKEM